jgi:hypothetical protein
MNNCIVVDGDDDGAETNVYKYRNTNNTNLYLTAV